MTDVVDTAAVERTISRFREQGVALPTFAELADPTAAPAAMRAALTSVDPGAPSPANLWRVHWHNRLDGTLTQIPEHVVLPPSLTGVEAPIAVLLGNRFPMIGTHKVLAAYACLAPRLVSGSFDPTRHRAVWPSTGNYARGGVAISRIMGCRGVAVLPEHMSAERFEWLGRWVADPADIVRTPGSESNVKEIYDACHELEKDPANVILNQFCEYGNHLVHRLATGRALERVAEHLGAGGAGVAPRAFVSASGSAGTIGAGDYLKEQFGTITVAVEALECPTLLNNGYGEHNIQGIGDKHVPLIHNVMNTDVVAAISDRATDSLNVLANTDTGRAYLHQRGVDKTVIEELDSFGLSSWCNVLAAIKVAKHFRYGKDDLILTVATDGAAMYRSERDKVLASGFPDGFERAEAAAVVAEHLLGQTDDHLLDCTDVDRNRIFNLGYFTWVEQQGLALEDFEARRDQRFWRGLLDQVPEWDASIIELNERSGVVAAA
jgi:cysteine synthase